MQKITIKSCIKCRQSKPFGDFYLQSTGRDGRKATCKTCVNEQMLAYSRNRYASPIGRAKQMFNSAKCRAKRDGIEFTIYLDQILILVSLGYCPKTGFRFDLTPPRRGQTNPFTPSIDRIDAKKGYEPNNIQVVCNMFNMGKSDHNEIDFIAMCLAIAERNSTNPIAAVRLLELRNARV